MAAAVVGNLQVLLAIYGGWTIRIALLARAGVTVRVRSTGSLRAQKAEKPVRTACAHREKIFRFFHQGR